MNRRKKYWEASKCIPTRAFALLQVKQREILQLSGINQQRQLSGFTAQSPSSPNATFSLELENFMQNQKLVFTHSCRKYYCTTTWSFKPENERNQSCNYLQCRLTSLNWSISLFIYFHLKKSKSSKARVGINLLASVFFFSCAQRCSLFNMCRFGRGNYVNSFIAYAAGDNFDRTCI